MNKSWVFVPRRGLKVGFLSLRSWAAEKPAAREKNKERVQRSYFLDRDIDRALKRMSLEEEKNLTEAVNEILRNGLAKYL